MKETISAGGVVVNSKGEILLVEQRGKVWSFPKGHVEEGESFLDAARREILEESGLRKLDLVQELGRYRRPKIGLTKPDDPSEMKTLILFLFKTTEMQIKPLDPNILDVRWVPLKEVSGRLFHSKDKEFFQAVSETVLSAQKT